MPAITAIQQAETSRRRQIDQVVKTDSGRSLADA